MRYFHKGGWWLPEGDEAHLKRWMTDVNQRWDNRLTYQRNKYDAVMKLVKTRRVAVDVGAHVGLWSWMMAHDFPHVRAFEPNAEHVRCWKRNMAGRKNAKVSEVALGAEDGHARLSRDGNPSMLMAIGPTGDRVRVRALDKFNMARIDLLKIDCEGYELFVLQGAEETLWRTKPVIIVEQKEGTGMEERFGTKPGEAVDFLLSMGAVLRKEIRGDFILSWEDESESEKS